MKSTVKLHDFFNQFYLLFSMLSQFQMKTWCIYSILLLLLINSVMGWAVAHPPYSCCVTSWAARPLYNCCVSAWAAHIPYSWCLRHEQRITTQHLQLLCCVMSSVPTLQLLGCAMCTMYTYMPTFSVVHILWRKQNHRYTLPLRQPAGAFSYVCKPHPFLPAWSEKTLYSQQLHIVITRCCSRSCPAWSGKTLYGPQLHIVITRWCSRSCPAWSGKTQQWEIFKTRPRHPTITRLEMY